MMKKSNILFSIQPKYIKMISDGNKLIEYRNTFWKVSYPQWFYVYESKPISQLKYLILLDFPISNGEKIPFDTYKTDDFNEGKMNRKYAYPILDFKEMSIPIPLKKLRSLGVTPPQNFCYINNFPKLVRELKK
ncbi:hypothetical protein RZ70_05280 [Apilactobacillus kunkeei]|uniref:hypothetical protein n=1 Tax=Apilactobacillus kunkeei TaxID=148814 RepID=UPI0006C0D450|nr:hypothetical protein [Apilactobacillus kunkeei]KOY76037.1 hypothetical protein RZ70_05280 [Apilactobacillus kunkeei]